MRKRNGGTFLKTIDRGLWMLRVPEQDVEAEGADPEKRRKGKMNTMIETWKMCAHGSWEEAATKAGKNPTTTKCVDRTKKDEEGDEFVRCRRVARDFKPRQVGPRDEGLLRLCRRDPSQKKPWGVRGEACVCGREKMCTSTPDATKKNGSTILSIRKDSRLRRWLYGMITRWEDDNAPKLVLDGFTRGRAAPTSFYHLLTGVRVVVRGDDLAGAEVELRKVRGTLGSAPRGQREVENFGRSSGGRMKDWRTRRTRNTIKRC